MTTTTETPAPTSTTALKPVETDFLIIGAGPAGASLACFLARSNHTGILLSSSPGASLTPRAHMTNPPALECLRDCDPIIYDECVRLGNAGRTIEHYRWCETFAGKEYARTHAWGSGARKGEYELVSPCGYMDLPQNLLEPVLVKWACARGWRGRFDTVLKSFVEEEDEGVNGERKIVAKVLDCVTGLEYEIRTRYLFGADGGRSLVAKQLGLPFTSIPGAGFAVNLLLRADMSEIMAHRYANLHLMMRLEKDHPFIAMIRMVKPWTEWMFVFFPKGPDSPIPKYTDAEWKEVASDLIGDPKIDVEILDVSGWVINETSADVISKGNIFCLGDAIHRHPPTLGLGSNTCIQDAFNLAWKLSFVHSGLASPSLLSTYNTERQPVAAQLVTESNNILRFDINLWISMGLLPPGLPSEARINARATLTENSKEGRERRKAIANGVKGLHRELYALGTAMGQLYQSSAVYNTDESGPFVPGPREALNPFENYDPCTYPGRRLPHVLLGNGSQVPGPLTSTLDIAGKGQFCLFTGIGGEGWKDAAAAVKDKFGVKVDVATIGVGLEWADVYLEWIDKREVEDDGCVLVRPDYFVAWRAMESGNEVDRLVKVMGSVLGFGDEKVMPSREATNSIDRS